MNLPHTMRAAPQFAPQIVGRATSRRYFALSGEAKQSGARHAWPAIVLSLALAAATQCRCQAVPPRIPPWDALSAGGTFSGYRLDYGQRLLLGASAFVEANYTYRYGVEAEGRWLWLHQRDGVRESTYLIGPRFVFKGLGDDEKKFRPYAKFLVGVASFRYPYDYATGKYFVLAPGGGVDYRLSYRIRLRLIDVEYQVSPQFTFGTLSSFGASSGLRVRLF